MFFAVFHSHCLTCSFGFHLFIFFFGGGEGEGVEMPAVRLVMTKIFVTSTFNGSPIVMILI